MKALERNSDSSFIKIGIGNTQEVDEINSEDMGKVKAISRGDWLKLKDHFIRRKICSYQRTDSCCFMSGTVGCDTWTIGKADRRTLECGVIEVCFE